MELVELRVKHSVRPGRRAEEVSWRRLYQKHLRVMLLFRTNSDAGNASLYPANILLIAAVACRVLCGFSISANLTNPSPIGPNPTPGDTATSASSSSSFENSSDPSSLYCSGSGAHTNMVPLGGSTGQPASFNPLIRTSRRFWYIAQIFLVSSSHSRKAMIEAI